MTKSRVKELMEEIVITAVSLPPDISDKPQWLSSVEHIIDVCQQALNLGLVGTDEVFCHVMLGNALYGKMRIQSHEIQTIIKSGINHAPSAYRSLTEFETALKHDAQSGGEYFVDPIQRTAYLKCIGMLWLLQSRYLKNSAGNNSAISYLQEKIHFLDYLQGSFLPEISLELARLIEKEGNKQIAIQWLHHASNAEVRTLDTDSFSAKSKREAQNALSQLEQRVCSNCGAQCSAMDRFCSKCGRLCT